MRILAAFDGSPMSEASLRQLVTLAHESGDDVLFFSVVESTPNVVRMRGPLRPRLAMSPLPGAEGVTQAADASAPVEVKSQALERAISERMDYLADLAAKLPPTFRTSREVVAHNDPACAIIERALGLQPDIIVMTTHGHTGLVHILFGDVAEEVVRSGVAPVLLVHPEDIRHTREQSRASDHSPGVR